ncbi:ribose ABC transport system ATP-binding protein RbsA [Vibrio variabilis]|uniref:Ribose ABC transport system ATP-binding protein RbsA n=1 Tax=Vibrio variabilis TaxID=990271 RepID=A0ABQ0JIS1_9VIBR|nr:ribose ABC transport system ATP-binding protein RbsA [Vibrio variabilis]
MEDVSFSVKKGEILGVVGLEGSGNHELLLGLFGAYGNTTSGHVILNGKPYRVKSPGHAIKNNMALLTNDRKNNGLVLGMSIENNISMASLTNFSKNGWLNQERESAVALQHQSGMNIKFSSAKQPVSDLSGGNQQKVVLAKWLESMPEILFLDDPTRGVDVGAKKEIYELMNRWTEEGMTIVLLSSELPEIMAMSDRFIVMHRGKVTARFEKSEATQENVLQAAMGINF